MTEHEINRAFIIAVSLAIAYQIGQRGKSGGGGMTQVESISWERGG